MENMNWQNIIETIATGLAVVATLFSVIGAMRAGVLKRLKLGGIEIETSPEERKQIREILQTVSTPGEPIPFETEQLALYYGQILSQSKISFWFSLVFASLGFLILMIAVFMYSHDSVGITVAQFIAGTIMDAVAALFFVQSRNAQKSMGDFFDKLRRDRSHLESRKLCNNIEDKIARDALRIQLSLHYAEVLNANDVSKHIIETSLPRYRPG